MSEIPKVPIRLTPDEASYLKVADNVFAPLAVAKFLIEPTNPWKQELFEKYLIPDWHKTTAFSHKCHILLISNFVLNIPNVSFKFIERLFEHDASKLQSRQEMTAYSLMFVLQDNRLFISEADMVEGLRVFKDVGCAHHYKENSHHPEHGPMSADSVLECVIDGLACILERQSPDTPTELFDKYFLNRHKDNKERTEVEECLNQMRDRCKDISHEVWLGIKLTSFFFKRFTHGAPVWTRFV
ncbi:protein ORF10 [Lake sturgeon herpesvirus]|nr:protein ORF10 [Lake sturgeon herpesvirus]